MKTLFYNTVTPLLKTILTDIMAEPQFNPFILVGQRGQLVDSQVVLS